MTEASNRKHTLVVGGTRGTGRVFVRALAKENHVLSVVSRRRPLEPAPKGPDVHYWYADLSDEFKKTSLSVEVLPKHLDEEVAALMVEGFGGVLTRLTAGQADYINVAVDGPFKNDSYRY